MNRNDPQYDPHPPATVVQDKNGDRWRKGPTRWWGWTGERSVRGRQGPWELRLAQLERWYGPIQVVSSPVDALTSAQQRILDQVKTGPHVYTGRARKPVEALEKLGLVTVDWDLVLHAIGGATWRITVTLKT